MNIYNNKICPFGGKTCQRECQLYKNKSCAFSDIADSMKKIERALQETQKLISQKSNKQ